MEVTDEQIIIKLQTVKEKSEEMYEKNIYLISSGTLLLSMAFIEKIVTLDKAICLWLLVTCWVLMVFTLLLNLVSHQVSSYFHGRTVEDFRNSNEQTLVVVAKRNSIMFWINISTSSALIIGIGSLVLFCSLNIYKMNRMTKETEHIRPQTIEPDQQKGMPINIPRGPSINVPPPSQPSQPAQPVQAPTPTPPPSDNQ